MSKYITIIDYKAESATKFEYLENQGETAMQAVAFAAIQFSNFSPVFNVKVAKLVAKNKYLPIYAIYADGGLEDYRKSDWNGWGKIYHTVTPDMIKPE